MARRAALVLAAAYGVLVFGWLPYWLGGVATQRRFRFPDTENAGLTPASFQLPFEDLTFRARDGVALRGWWVPAAESRGSVVLVHGLNRSRIEMARKLPFLSAQGWNALAFDLRHHGESGGEVSSFGAFEKQDVQAAVALAQSRAAGPVVVWGVSLGGATSVLAAAEDAGIRGVVCDSAYRSLRDTAAHHLGLFRGRIWWLRGVPVWPVGDEVVYWIGRRGGFDPDSVDVTAAASRLSDRPTLFVCRSNDARMPQEIAVELQRAAGPRARLLVVPGEKHGGAWRDGQAAYEHAVAGLLEASIGGAGAHQAGVR